MDSINDLMPLYMVIGMFLIAGGAFLIASLFALGELVDKLWKKYHNK